MGDPRRVKKTHNPALILPSNIFGESVSVFLVNLVVARTRTLWLGFLHAVTVTVTPTLPFFLLSACFPENLLELVASPFTKSSTSSQSNKT